MCFFAYNRIEGNNNFLDDQQHGVNVLSRSAWLLKRMKNTNGEMV